MDCIDVHRRTSCGTRASDQTTRNYNCSTRVSEQTTRNYNNCSTRASSDQTTRDYKLQHLVGHARVGPEEEQPVRRGRDRRDDLLRVDRPVHAQLAAVALAPRVVHVEDRLRSKERDGGAAARQDGGVRRAVCTATTSGSPNPGSVPVARPRQHRNKSAGHSLECRGNRRTARRDGRSRGARAVSRRPLPLLLSQWRV